MSENWAHYVANMEGHTASIVFDKGIAETIKSLPENISYLITAPLQEMNDSRMPTDAEAERLETLLDELEAFFEQIDGYCVGRVTSNGVRHHFFYVNIETREISEGINKLGQSRGYELRVGSRNDPRKEAYFEDLYPDPESYQVMMDMSVIGHLLDAGDDIGAERRVDHMAIFSSKSAAKSYAEWAQGAGYEVDPIRKLGTFFKKSFYVESHNTTAVTVYAINPHSLGHFRKALEFGGEYDGWGCSTVPQRNE